MQFFPVEEYWGVAKIGGDGHIHSAHGGDGGRGHGGTGVGGMPAGLFLRGY